MHPPNAQWTMLCTITLQFVSHVAQVKSMTVFLVNFDGRSPVSLNLLASMADKSRFLPSVESHLIMCDGFAKTCFDLL
jgi:hypothetical protein